MSSHFNVGGVCGIGLNNGLQPEHFSIIKFSQIFLSFKRHILLLKIKFMFIKLILEQDHKL
jgi:hypothetical protein